MIIAPKRHSPRFEEGSNIALGVPVVGLNPFTNSHHLLSSADLPFCRNRRDLDPMNCGRDLVRAPGWGQIRFLSLEIDCLGPAVRFHGNREGSISLLVMFDQWQTWLVAHFGQHVQKRHLLWVPHSDQPMLSTSKTAHAKGSSMTLVSTHTRTKPCRRHFTCRVRPGRNF